MCYTGEATRIRSVPFEHIGWYGTPRTDFVMYRPSWGQEWYDIGMLDWRPAEHWREAGYGRVILLFKAVICEEIHSLAFIEVFYPIPTDAWRHGDLIREVLNEQHGNLLLYGGSPERIYEVIRVEDIMGPVPIMHHPIHYTIPPGSLKRVIMHGSSDDESGMGEGDGQIWTNVGSTEPKRGRFRTTSHTLRQKLLDGETQFSAAEWAMHGCSDIQRDDYVLAGTNYYVCSGNGSEMYILNYWALTRGCFPGWVRDDNVGRYKTPFNPFVNVRTAVQYLLALKGRFPIFICLHANGKANCNAKASGKSCEAKTREYKQVVELKGGITVVCSSNDRKIPYANAPMYCYRILGLNRYEVITNQQMQDLIIAWAGWKAQCPRQYAAGLKLIRQQKGFRKGKGFSKGKGVCYKILDAIDVEDEHLYLVPSSEFPGAQASGVSEYFWGAQIWQGELPQSQLEELGYVFPAVRKKRRNKKNAGGTKRTEEGS